MVVLASSGNGLYNAGAIGRFLRDSEWQSDRRPKAANISSQIYGSYAGQYQRSPDFALGLFAMRQYFLSAPKAAIYVPAGLGLGVLLVLVWRAGSFRKRWIILASDILVSGLLTAFAPLVWSHVFCARFQPGVEIRC